MGTRRLIAAGAVAALALAGGIAYASTGGGGAGPFDACAKTANGQLRLDTGGGCLPSEQPITLGGATHADETGFYRGPNVERWLPIVSGRWPDVRPFMTHVATVHLDAGDYVVSAELIAENDQGQGVVVCLLGTPSLGYALAQSAVGGWRPGFALQQTFTEQSTFALDAPTDLELQCFNAPPNDPPGNPRIGLADVIATRVDSVSATQQ